MPWLVSKNKGGEKGVSAKRKSKAGGEAETPSKGEKRKAPTSGVGEDGKPWKKKQRKRTNRLESLPRRTCYSLEVGQSTR